MNLILHIACQAVFSLLFHFACQVVFSLLFYFACQFVFLLFHFTLFFLQEKVGSAEQWNRKKREPKFSSARDNSCSQEEVVPLIG